MFPDLSKDGNTFAEWETKAKEYEARLPGTRFMFSDLLERLAPQQDKNKGKDIADFLMKQDWRYFKEVDQYARTREGKLDKTLQPKEDDTKDHENTTQTGRDEKAKVIEVERIGHVKEYEGSQWFGILDRYTQESVNKECWSSDIKKLEDYFTGVELPIDPVKLNRCSTITNCPSFIKKHLATVKANNGNKTFLPYLNRLKRLQGTLDK